MDWRELLKLQFHHRARLHPDAAAELTRQERHTGRIAIHARIICAKVNVTKVDQN